MRMLYASRDLSPRRHGRAGPGGCHRRRRVTIARALVKDTPIVLLDEASRAAGRRITSGPRP
ncbi:hypothetical protein ACFOWZ_04115 [Lentzea rhizosphaerae]|uniref:ABC transporter n=1 Tax=Lentzea rhizosphaerae TaxID=2041025 RepID=A0ABV8BMZ9_9PSEU